MSNGPENRRSFRVDESVCLKVEILTDDQYAEGMERHKLHAGMNDNAQALLVDIEARLSEAMYLLSGESEKMGKVVTLLNDKLNVVIEQVPTLRETKNSLAKSPPQICNVGADGMVFSSKKPLEVGTKLYLQFLLLTDNRYVETFAHVVRVTDPPDSNPDWTHGVAVAFDGMKPAQREVLIQYMFSKESETLRMRRLQLDAIDR